MTWPCPRLARTLHELAELQKARQADESLLFMGAEDKAMGRETVGNFCLHAGCREIAKGDCHRQPEGLWWNAGIMTQVPLSSVKALFINHKLSMSVL